MVGAQRQASRTFFVTTGCSNYCGTQGLGNLNGCHTNAAGAALHQQSLTTLQTATVKHIAPHGKKCLGQRSRLNITQALRHWQALTNGCHAILRVTTSRHQRTDTITQVESGPRHGMCITAFYDTSNLQPRYIGRTGRRRIHARALQHVWPVDAARVHTNQHLARTDKRQRAVPQTQNVRTAEGCDFDYSHSRFNR